MTELEMGLELKREDVVDNPFDVMLHHSLELTRDLLFACHRLKNPNIPDGICTNLNRIDKRVDHIKSEFQKLLNLSDEAVAMCRKTSYYYNRPEFDRLNDILLKSERDMETLYSRCVPNRNDKFERIRLGKNSDEYKRIERLRFIINHSSDFSNLDRDFFSSLIDVIEIPDDCKKYWMTVDEFNTKKHLIDENELTTDDIKYMISYKFGPNI